MRLCAVLTLLAVSVSAYTLTDKCPVCCNIGQDPTNFDSTNPLSQRCDGPKNTYVGCCNEIGHCCPGILGFPSKKYLCCDTAKKETCKNSYEPVCFIAPKKETASQLYCKNIRENGRPGTCWRRCGLTAQPCSVPAPVIYTAPVAATYAAVAPVTYSAAAPVTYAAAPPMYSSAIYNNGLRQFTTSPLNSLSYGLNFAPQVSQLPYLATAPRTAAAPLYTAPVAPVARLPYTPAAPVTYNVPVPVCDDSAACSCDDACVVRGDCCFDYCAFCVTKP